MADGEGKYGRSQGLIIFEMVAYGVALALFLYYFLPLGLR